ncbi:MAG TPA: endonuclease/exonuclease/phosphatase family protein [Terriglobia bacterium]|nr:endonuclease/exonuclease/phosphatase family protein [Terriglobia bacterium]
MSERLLNADAGAAVGVPVGNCGRGVHAGRPLSPGAAAGDDIYRLIREEIQPHFAELRRCRSTPELLNDPVYRRLEPAIRTALDTPELGDFSRDRAPARARYRVVAWNLERGIELDGQLEALRSHPYLRAADVLLLTETDVGMARSRNRAVAQEIAREIGLHYAFVPCYLNLSKGSGVEYHAAGENELGLHGNAVLSRYPLRDVRAIFLKNGIDKMKGREKRLGRQAAVAAEVEFPNYSLTAVCSHLDANSSQRHRAHQMREILDGLRSAGPVVLGGDWNTTTYNSSDPAHAIAGFWLRVFMGVDNVINNHYLHPYRWFEKDLFGSLEQSGFDYRACNLIGERTGGYDAACAKTRQNLGEWVPDWCFAFMRWALRNHGGRCPIKIDWFATRGLRAESPVVIHELREACAVPLSDHDPIGVEVMADCRLKVDD